MPWPKIRRTPIAARTVAALAAAATLLASPISAVGAGAGDADDSPATASPEAAAAASGPNHVPHFQVRDQELWDVSGSSPNRFLVKGMIFEGFQQPYITQTDCLDKAGQHLASTTPLGRVCSRHLAAQDYYFGRGGFSSADGLKIAVDEWNINTVRLNVNLAALDPQSRFHRDLAAATAAGRPGARPYIDEIQDAVSRATSRNLAVILCVFSGENANQGGVQWGPPGNGQPIDTSNLRSLGDSNKDRHDFNSYNPGLDFSSASTSRAMVALATQFRNQPNVLIESLNEPGSKHDLDPSQSAISQYVNGGGLPAYQSMGSGLGPAIGVKKVLQNVRAAGYRNPVIVPSIGVLHDDYLARVENHTPGSRDDQVVYSAHPFPKKHRLNWDVEFGDFSRRHPVVLTAWQISKDHGWCTEDRDAPRAMMYAIKQGYNGGDPAVSNGTNIGIVGFAFDVHGSLTQKFANKTWTGPVPHPSLPDSTKRGCNAYGGGGKLLQHLFTTYNGNGLPR